MQQVRTLLILSPGFAASEADTVCIPAQQNFVRALVKNSPNTKIVILAFQYPFNRRPYDWEGAEVIPFNGQNKGKFNRLKLWLRVWQTMLRLKNERELSGILSFWCTECALLGSWIGKFSGIKHLCWILGQDARASNGFVRWIKPKPAELVAMSDFLAMEFYRNHKVYPQYLVPNGIDERLFAELAAERDIDILGVGSLIPLKQFDLFIDIVKKLVEKKPAIKAIICGDGPEKNKLQQLISISGMQANIELSGEKPNPEVLRLMQRSKILLHCSSYEGFSTVCLEALYTGAHVVSFVKPMDTVAAHHHIVQNENEMYQKVLELLNSNHVDHERVLLFSAKDTAAKMMSLFGVQFQADLL